MSTELLERDTIRPFGLTRAVPVRPVAHPRPALTLCPDQQINITEQGVPFVFEPSMATALTTTAQTLEDHQLDEETENDTD
jgi:putative ATP-grasp target RiPP